MQVVSVDILGPLSESEAGNSYALVAGEHFTKWMEAYAIPNQEVIAVARKLTDEMFCRFSPPEQLHSDQDRQFKSDLIKHICRILNVQKTRTSPYHPQKFKSYTTIHAGYNNPRTPLRLGKPDLEGMHGIQHEYAGIHWLHTFLFDV